MKKILLFSLLIFTVFISTGCAKFSYNIEVNEKDEVSITEQRELKYERNMPEDFYAILGSNIANYSKSYKEKGFEVKSASNASGANLFLHKDKISYGQANAYLPLGFKQDKEDNFRVQKTLLKNKYTIHLIYSIKDVIEKDLTNKKYFANTMNLLDPEIGYMVVMTSSLMNPVTGNSIITTRFLNGETDVTSYVTDKATGRVQYLPVLSIKIPVEATRHNAQKVEDNNVYVWDLSDSDLPMEIYIEYEKFNTVSFVMLCSIVILIIAVMYISKKINSSPAVRGL